MAEKETGAKAKLQKIEQATTTMPLARFLKTIEKKSRLSRKDRLRILDQALLLLEMNYVHLPLKRAMHAIDPIRRLKLLKFRLEEVEREMESETQFHKRLLEIFASLRDLHTHYRLPAPFRGRMAFLPFLVEQYFVPKKTRKQAARGPHKKARKVNCRDERDEKFIVSRIVHQFIRSSAKTGLELVSFQPGVEVVSWNGVPIKRAIELNGETQAGSNLEARFARGLDSLTIRPLDMSLPPDEEWVDVTYLPKAGAREKKKKTEEEKLTLRQKWLVYTKPLATKTTRKKRAAIDIKKTKINQLKKRLYQPERELTPDDVRVPKEFENIFYARRLDGRDIGYIRLFTFAVDDPDQFVQEFKRVIKHERFPQEGLIIDVRGNGGGQIRAGERLLQLFTPRRIKPELFEFINTPLNLEICKRAPKNWELSKWAKSIEEAVVTGAIYSSGFPFDSEESCNDIGQVYHGPVIVITDALSYSTTDMFAAGFQDNEVGEILGTSDNTGAGGANNWYYEDLMSALSKNPNSPFKPLPKGADLGIAIRRSIRVGPREGKLLEELGVEPDKRYCMTKRDLLKGNVDLIRYAVKLLRKKPIYSLSLEGFRRKASRGVHVTCASKIPTANTKKNISYLNIYLNDRFYRTIDAKDGAIKRKPVILKGGKGRVKVLVQAYDGANNLVAAYRHK
ncbi:MAG TPA: S41 family peptidase [Pyrinomonadaceae bacterium]|nr:S41 family peptidase [Pyrinomonadaceae bacterium]